MNEFGNTCNMFTREAFHTERQSSCVWLETSDGSPLLSTKGLFRLLLGGAGNGTVTGAAHCIEGFNIFS